MNSNPANIIGVGEFIIFSMYEFLEDQNGGLVIFHSN